MRNSLNGTYMFFKPFYNLLKEVVRFEKLILRSSSSFAVSTASVLSFV